MTCAPSEDSDQPWHQPQSDQCSLSAWKKLGSLATHWAHSKDWSDWADPKADLSLRWAHGSFCWFCCAVTQLIIWPKINSWLQHVNDQMWCKMVSCGQYKSLTKDLKCFIKFLSASPYFYSSYRNRTTAVGQIQHWGLLVKSGCGPD